MVGDDDKMFMTRSLNIMPKTTEQHLVVHSDKSVAYITNGALVVTLRTCYGALQIVVLLLLLLIKDCARRFIPLKLTTNRHEASRGLFATAELLFLQTGSNSLHVSNSVKAVKKE